ncbi:hypothetical protein [Virgibacillus sp. JSM 102003]|uniref:hypothetical protein n=1 Tax=Virgibacillus sp. JSM 102003 TaxID=1562108 RepID=UPI0035C1BE54
MLNKILLYEKVVCVFEPSKWFVIEEGPEKGRKKFDGIEAEESVLLKLQDNEDKLLSKFGTGSAAAYMSLEELNL